LSSRRGVSHGMAPLPTAAGPLVASASPPLNMERQSRLVRSARNSTGRTCGAARRTGSGMCRFWGMKGGGGAGIRRALLLGAAATCGWCKVRQHQQGARHRPALLGCAAASRRRLLSCQQFSTEKVRDPPAATHRERLLDLDANVLHAQQQKGGDEGEEWRRPAAGRPDHDGQQEQVGHQEAAGVPAGGGQEGSGAGQIKMGSRSR